MKKLISLFVSLLIGSCLFADNNSLMEKLQREKIEATKFDKNVTDINIKEFTALTFCYNGSFMDKKTFNKCFKFIKKMEKKADWKLDLEESLSSNFRVETSEVDEWTLQRTNAPELDNASLLILEKNNISIYFASSLSENVIYISLKITVETKQGKSSYIYTLNNELYNLIH